MGSSRQRGENLCPASTAAKQDVPSSVSDYPMPLTEKTVYGNFTLEDAPSPRKLCCQESQRYKVELSSVVEPLWLRMKPHPGHSERPFTLCLFVRKNRLCPLHRPLQKLSGTDLTGFLDRRHSSHFGFGAGGGATGDAGEILAKGSKTYLRAHHAAGRYYSHVPGRHCISRPRSRWF